jgi:putative GTP pyrophosphokinase
MAKSKRSIAAMFLTAYSERLEHYRVAAQQLELLISDILLNIDAEIHQICARHKDLDSLRLKLREKKYSRPGQQLTDKVAGRVITYYQRDVAIVTAKLKEALLINEKQSEDKRIHLKDPEFGYTSVHLIAKLKGSWASSPKYFELRNMWFEIQIRSILEHAWAEIEHEIVYKSGIKYPKGVKRRFARLAGTIELLEDEFLNLKDEQVKLIDGYVMQFRKGHDLNTTMDSAKLISLLECDRPEALGWRKAAQEGRPFSKHSEVACTRALAAAGIKSPHSLREALKSAGFRRAERFFRVDKRIVEQLSHLALAQLVVAFRRPDIFGDYFPELLADPVIQALWRRRRRK